MGMGMDRQMATGAADPLYLVEFFREFHAAVLHHRAQLDAAAAPTPVEEDSVQIREADILAEDEVPAEERSQLAPDVIQARLLELLESQVQAVQRRGDAREQKRFTDIQYVMAAMSDEVFLSVEWASKEYWSTHLLEERLFGTHDAGTRFFANLDALLQHRDASRADVLLAYLMALSLGFRGKLRDVSTDAQLAHYRHQAYVTLFQRNPGLPENTPLFSQAYAHTRGGQQPSWLPQLRPWVLSLFMVAAGYLIVAHFIWDRRSSVVTARLDELNTRLGTSQAPTRSAADSGASAPRSGASPVADGSGRSGSGSGRGARLK